MKHAFRFSLALVAALAAATLESRAADLADREMRALRALATEADARWDRRDAEGLAALYADAATLQVAGGRTVEGHEGIHGYFVDSFAGMDPSLRHVTRLVGLREVAPGVVFADGQVRLERIEPDGSRALVRYFVNHTLVVREGDRWKLKAVRAHPRPTAEAPPAG